MVASLSCFLSILSADSIALRYINFVVKVVTLFITIPITIVRPKARYLFLNFVLLLQTH